ncbi:hypothetical protein [Streptomyces sp. C]|uniref:hypothetical protein n=1 Tax=Streptomyces sp. C TaxID=253839 RepID=UPI00101B55A7|nr:hypothetical protein [Streptomyces sp. C]
MSDRVKSTEPERLERLRGLLSGARSKDRVGRALGQGSEYGNVLLGAMLHGADRLRQGHTPTDLERLLLGALGTVVPDAEARQWGRVYREAVTGQGGRLPVVPQTITSRPVAQGYTMANLKQDLNNVVAEALAAPNVQIVDPQVAAAGGEEDPAFVEAMRQTGFAVTAFARPSASRAAVGTAEDGDRQTQEEAAGTDAEQGGGLAAPSFRLKLELENFYVRRAVGDAGWSRDEIYWTAAAASGSASGTFISEEFGAVKADQTRSFSSTNKLLFEGQSSGYLGLQIQCWEADQSSDEWWNALVKALNDAAAAIDRFMLIDNFIGFVPLWAGMAFEISKMFLFIIEAFRNYDDLSCQRAIGLDQQDLAVIAHYGKANWHFNGDGHHELRVKYAGDPVPFPVGTLRYAVRTGSTWGAPIALDFESMTPPALASYNGVLHAVFVRPADKAVMWSRLESPAGVGGGSPVWSKPERIGGDTSLYTPALTAGHGKLFYAVTGQDSGLYWRTYNGSAWSAVHRIDPAGVRYSPALATYSNRVWMVTVGLGHDLYLHTHNGTSWSTWYGDNLDWAVDKGAALAPQGGQLWRIVTGRDNSLHTSTSGGGAEWTGRGTRDPWKSNHSPALATHGDTMWIFVRGLDGDLYAGTYTGTWSGLHKVSNGAAKPMDAPTATVHHNKIHVMYRQ